MVTGRPVWVLDEPTVSLDQVAVTMFGKVIEAHLEAGGAAIMATHIDLGLKNAISLDLGAYKATSALEDNFDEAFL